MTRQGSRINLTRENTCKEGVSTKKKHFAKGNRLVSLDLICISRAATSRSSNNERRVDVVMVLQDRVPIRERVPTRQDTPNKHRLN